MSHSPSSVSVKDVKRIVTAPALSVPKLDLALLWVLVALGIGAFAYGLLGDDPKATWASFLASYMFWFVAAAAGAGFASVIHICNAQWARPIARIFDSSTTFLGFMILGLGVLYIGHHEIYSWSHHPIEGKGVWLTSNFLFARDFLAMGLLVYLTRKVVALSVERDIGAIRGGVTGLSEEETSRWNSAAYQKCGAGWGRDTAAGIRKNTALMWRLSPLVVAMFATIITLLTFDLIMSVDPHWYSTLFGALVFMSGVYVAVAWCAMSLCLARELHPLYRAKIERRTLHDLGKLLFGFGIFWAYMFWSHYLTIWYGNMPEFTGWVITRVRNEPWHSLAWIVLGASFIIPFLLGLSRDVKQVPQLLFATAAIVMCGIWLQFYLLVVPTLYPNTIPLGVTDVLIAIGFGAAYLLTQAHFLARVPLIPFGDFYEGHVVLPEASSNGHRKVPTPSSEQPGATL